MQPPEEVSGVHCFLGTVNPKFIPKLAELTQPIRELLNKHNHWTWGQSQQQAFERIKQALITPPTLAHFNPNFETLVSADASNYGLGEVLLQKQNLNP